MRQRMTPKEMNARRNAAQANVFTMANALHDIGFTTLHIESVQVGMEDYYTRIIIDRRDLGSDEMDTLITTCRAHNAQLTLRDDHEYGVRLAVWAAS